MIAANETYRTTFSLPLLSMNMTSMNAAAPHWTCMTSVKDRIHPGKRFSANLYTVSEHSVVMIKDDETHCALNSSSGPSLFHFSAATSSSASSSGVSCPNSSSLAVVYCRTAPFPPLPR